MTSGEECRLYQAIGHCFACYPGGSGALLDMIMGVDDASPVVLGRDAETDRKEGN